MSDDIVFSCEEPKSEPMLRVLMLGALYALALFCAVVFSPAMNLASPHPTGEIGRVASMEEPVRR